MNSEKINFKNNFDFQPNRLETNCFKWDGRKKFLGFENLIPMHIADNDFICSPEILVEIIDRAKKGTFGYSFHADDYFDPFVSWIQKHHSWEISRNWCGYSPSAVSTISFVINALSQEGDGVIVQTPIYPPFLDVIRSNGRTIRNNRLLKNDKNDYSMDLLGFEKLCEEENTKIFILCSPHNPVGRVWTLAELTKIAEICLRNNVTIVSDELHCDLVYPNFVHVPIASLSKEVSMNTITIMAPSKTFNLPGLACSAFITENKLIKSKIYNMICRFHLEIPQVFGITAFHTAYKKGESWLNELLQYLQLNRQHVVQWFSEYLPIIKPNLPQATYLSWIDFREFEKNDGQLKTFVYEKAGVALDPGAKFGSGGEGFMRLNFACPRAQLNEALLRITNAIKEIQQ